MVNGHSFMLIRHYGGNGNMCLGGGLLCPSASSFILFRYFMRFSELTFTFAVMLSPVRLSSVCLSSVTLVHPNQAVEIFGNISTSFIWYLGHPLTSIKNFKEIVPGEPLRRGS